MNTCFLLYIYTSQTGQSVCYWLNDQTTGLLFLAGTKALYLLHGDQTDSGAQAASWPLVTRGSSPEEEAA